MAAKAYNIHTISTELNMKPAKVRRHLRQVGITSGHGKAYSLPYAAVIGLRRWAKTQTTATPAPKARLRHRAAA